MSNSLAKRCTMIVTTGNEQIKERSGGKSHQILDNRWLRKSLGWCLHLRWGGLGEENVDETGVANLRLCPLLC